MKVVALAGGVGGARLADGLRRTLPAEDLTLIVNTADDFEHLGLKISPDLDTVTYTSPASRTRRPAGDAPRRPGPSSTHLPDSVARHGFAWATGIWPSTSCARRCLPPAWR